VRSLEQLFNKFMDQTFGTKIEMFKRACRAYPFCDELRAILTDACNDLDASVGQSCTRHNLGSRKAAVEYPWKHRGV